MREGIWNSKIVESTSARNTGMNLWRHRMYVWDIKKIKNGIFSKGCWRGAGINPDVIDVN